VVGVDAETDEEFAQKRNLSLENPGFSTSGSLAARLLNISGVTDARVYENDTDTLAADTDLGAHSIWPVVEGGTVADIMQELLIRKTGGTGIKGSIEQLLLETLTRPDGSTFVVSQTRRFDRPENIPVYVNVTATRKDALIPVDVPLLKQKISRYKFFIGTPLQAGFLYEPAYDAGDSFILTGMEISADDATFTEGRIAPAPGGKFSIIVANVDVTEVTP